MNGVIYYNTGISYLVRLLVSAYSLRRFYSGDIAILSWGDASHYISSQIAKAVNAQLIRINPQIESSDSPQFLVKTRLHEFSPFVNTLYLDADTLILKKIDNLFPIIKTHSFLASTVDGWKTTDEHIRTRLEGWRGFYPQHVKKALKFGRVINCGVMGFNRTSTLLKSWYKFTLPGKNLFVPDEIACQLLLTEHPHTLVDSRYNCMSKYCNIGYETKIVHYHARKHCTMPQAKNWLGVYYEVISKNVANIKSWQPANDKILKQYLDGNR